MQSDLKVYECHCVGLMIIEKILKCSQNNGSFVKLTFGNIHLPAIEIISIYTIQSAKSMQEINAISCSQHF